MIWKRKQFPPLNPIPSAQVAALQGDALTDEKTRSEIEQLRLDILADRSWRTKLFLSLIIPVGGALAFLNTWINDHDADRRLRKDQTYSQAAKQLGSNEASVRLNAVIVLSSFVQTQTFRQRLTLNADPGPCVSDIDARGRQSMALIIGDLTTESDAGVLDQIAAIANQCPDMAVAPLLSLDRSAAVRFARSAGNFAGVYLLAKNKAITLDNTGGAKNLSQSNRELLDAITTRSGSPFEAKDSHNQVFVSAPMLKVGSACPFGELYDKQFDLTVSSEVNHPLLDKPPTNADVRKAMADMMTDAELLEKASYVLSRVATDSNGSGIGKGIGIKLLTDQDFLRHKTFSANLFGVAIVVGNFNVDESGQAAARLRSMGAFVQYFDAPNTCPLPKPPTP